MARFNSTTNYGWPNPDSTDKVNTAGYWGTDLETCINSIDSKLKEVEDSVPSVISPSVNEIRLASTQTWASGSDVTVNFEGTGWSTGVYTFATGTAGLYNVKARIKALASTNTGSYRLLQMRYNGSIQDYNRTDNLTNIGLDVNSHIAISDGDTLEFRATQDSGSNMSLQSGVYCKCELTRFSDTST